MADIIVIGGCIVDLMSYVTRFPRPGETMTGNNFFKGFGGKGANQCVMAKKLGVSTALIAKLGDDAFGLEYLENLKSLDVNYDHVTLSKASHTSTAAITVSEEGQNIIVYVPGAIMELKPSDISAAENLIRKAKVMLCTYECPLDTLMTALTLAKKYKVKTVVNAAPATDSSYEQIYPLTDIICLNEIEAEEATKLSIKSLQNATSAIEILHKKGCSTAIITLGKSGAVYQTKGESNHHEVPAKTVKAVDSTGAGDAFMGSLVYYLSQFPHLTIENIIQRSCDIATLSVLKKGTQTSFPNREDLPNDFFE